VQDWELLVLHKLRWELSSTVALDYLDHLLPRLPGLPPALDAARLRLKTETVIALAATHTQFLAVCPSLMAASSLLTALLSANLEAATAAAASGGRDGVTTLEAMLTWQEQPAAVMSAGGASPVVSESLLREVRLCLQILTHAAAADLDLVCRQIRDCLPAYLTGQQQHAAAAAEGSAPASPDTTLCPPSPSLYPVDHHQEEKRPASRCPSSRSSSCSENPASASAFPFASFPGTGVDVFSDLKSTVLEAVLSGPDSGESSASDSLLSNSILVT
jgi:hypothetical protein